MREGVAATTQKIVFDACLICVVDATFLPYDSFSVRTKVYSRGSCNEIWRFPGIGDHPQKIDQPFSADWI